MNDDNTAKGSALSIVTIILRILVHIMAMVLLARGIMGLFFTPGYEAGHISPEDQNHLRVFWAVPIIASIAIHCGLYSFYASKSAARKGESRLLLRGVALWMAVAALVRVFAILVLGDPMPRVVPIVVEFSLSQMLWFLSRGPADNARTL